ncbi:hypothetical protein HH308_18060 [Gordonia sp. TBRC 11910]|uniref:Uncharacterized protein n=1 Tax=Gordonia asplenii TaxID=2725283 RepID=A0A848KWX4_9ACTN|nr:hypothetical protein [Gordonia asplenii]NMO03120.1 hypothetical protein [Gordonia asplenii]
MTQNTPLIEDAVTHVGIALSLINKALADVTPRTVDELLQLADMAVDAGRGALDVVTAVTR